MKSNKHLNSKTITSGDVEIREINKQSIIGDPEKYIYTSLFNRTYVLNHFKFENQSLWNGEKGDFDYFFDNFFSVCQSVSGAETAKWNHTETLDNWILPILHFLNWSGPIYRDDDKFALRKSINFVDETGNDCNIRPSVIISETVEGNQKIKNSRIENCYQETRRHSLVSVSTGYYDSWAEKRSGKYNSGRDEHSKFGDVFSNYNCNEKSSYYLQALGHNWAIATDGYTWRLYNKEYTHSNNHFFEFKLGRLFDDIRTSQFDQEDEKLRDAVKFFYYFFSKEGLFGKPISIATLTLSKSKNYFEDLEEDLKGRFVHAMTIAVNGLFENLGVRPDKVKELDLVRDTAESLIFTLLFIRSCESRRVIPLNQRYLKVALATLVKKIKDFDPHVSIENNFEKINFSLQSLFGKLIKPQGFEVFNYVTELNEIIQKGTGVKYDFGFKIDGFKETVFSTEEMALLKRTKMDNETIIKLIFEIFYEYSSGKNQEIPFESFSPRNLGSIFESFLEFKVEFVNEKYVHLKKKYRGKIVWDWKPFSKLKYAEKALVTYSVNKGQLRFRPNDEEKSDTGAFYTPEYLVQFMVRETLGPLVKGKSSNEIRKLRVCDPAMGSGHFLVAAFKFLSKHYIATSAAEGESFQSISKSKWKILDSCIFGIDLNPRAVKLTKMSLWLETTDTNRKLENLDDQIIRGNSLTGEGIYGKKGQEKFRQPFDVIIGNPPYGALIVEEDEAKVDSFFKELFPKGLEIEKFSKVDTFGLFVLSCYRTVSSEGRVSLLISDTFRTIKSFEKIREFLLKSRAVIRADVMPRDAFSPVVVNTCFVELSGSGIKNEFIESRNFEEISSLDFERAESLQTIFRHPVEGLLKISNKPLLADIDSSVRDMLFSTPETLGLIEKSLVGSYQGLATGNDPAYIAVLEGANLEGLNIKTGIDSLIKIKRDKIRTSPLSNAEKVNGISGKGPKYVGFIKATRAARYFYESPLYIEWSTESVNKMRTTKNDKGRVAARLQNKEKYFLDALVSDGTEGILSTYFIQNSIPAVSTNVILSETDKFTTKYLCGLLNSSLMSYVLSNSVNASLKGMSSHVTPMDIERLPFCPPTNVQLLMIENLVDKLVEDFTEDQNIVRNNNQILLDNIVFDIYKIPAKARKVVAEWFESRRKKGVSGFESSLERSVESKKKKVS